MSGPRTRTKRPVSPPVAATTPAAVASTWSAADDNCWTPSSAAFAGRSTRWRSRRATTPRATTNEPMVSTSPIAAIVTQARATRPRTARLVRPDSVAPVLVAPILVMGCRRPVRVHLRPAHAAATTRAARSPPRPGRGAATRGTTARCHDDRRWPRSTTAPGVRPRPRSRRRVISSRPRSRSPVRSWSRRRERCPARRRIPRDRSDP